MTIQNKILGQLVVDSLDYENSYNWVAKPYLDSDQAIYSTDGGLEWYNSSLPSSGEWRALGYGGDKFVNVKRSSSEGAYSTDGVAWTSASMPSSQAWEHVLYSDIDNSFTVVPSYTASVARSTDGITWTSHSTTLSTNITSAIYANGYYALFPENGSTNITISSTGTSWQQSSGIGVTWPAVAFGKDRFVAVSNNGTSFGYSDTLPYYWTTYTAPVQDRWISVAYSDEIGGGMFVSVALLSNKAIYSTDGLSWNLATLPEDTAWNKVVAGKNEFGNPVFRAVSNTSDSYAESTNGVSWVSKAFSSRLSTSGAQEIAFGEKINPIYNPKTVYTVPSNTQTVVTSIIVSNISDTSDTFTIAVVPSGESYSVKNNIIINRAIDAKSYDKIDTKITLSSGDSLVAISSSLDKLNITAFGIEDV